MQTNENDGWNIEVINRLKSIGMPIEPLTDKLSRLLLDPRVTFDAFFRETTTWDLAHLLDQVIITQNTSLFNLIIKLIDNQTALINVSSKKYRDAWLQEIYL